MLIKHDQIYLTVTAVIIFVDEYQVVFFEKALRIIFGVRADAFSIHDCLKLCVLLDELGCAFFESGPDELSLYLPFLV